MNYFLDVDNRAAAEVDDEDKEGLSPFALHIACLNKKLDEVKILVDGFGCDVNARGSDRTNLGKGRGTWAGMLDGGLGTRGLRYYVWTFVLEYSLRGV